MKKIEGIFAAMMTPLNHQGEPDLNVLREMTEFMIEGGVTGLFPVSNVGGMIHMSQPEKAAVVKAVAEQARGRVPVYAGANASDTRGAVMLAQCYRELGADGCVLSAPYYFPYPQTVILQGLQSAVRHMPLPVVLYNIPKYAGEIQLDSLRVLMQEDNVVGIKDSSGSIAGLLRLLALREELRPEFAVFVGWEEMLLSALELGAQGCMTASSGIFPEIMAAIAEETRAGRLERARRLQQIIAEATDVFGKVFFPLGYQWAMEARGFAMGAYPVRFHEEMYAALKLEITQAVHRALKAFHQEMRPQEMRP